MPTNELKAGHINFKNEFKLKKDLFQKLAVHGQAPKVLWIGCSDSRVIPEQIMHADPGELFVHRNIANIIPPAVSDENSTKSVIEYAVNHLKVEHIVICGHTECGGMQAVLDNPDNLKDNGLKNWLKYALDAVEKTNATIENKKMNYLNTIKNNVLLQKENLLSYDFIQEKYNSGNLIIHSWLYDLYHGTIKSFDDDSQEWELLE